MWFLFGFGLGVISALVVPRYWEDIKAAWAWLVSKLFGAK